MLNEKHDDIIKSQAQIENSSKEVRETLKAIENAKEEANADFAKNKSALMEELELKENELEQKESEIELEKNKLSAMEEEYKQNRNVNAFKEGVKKTNTTKKTVKRNPDSVVGSNHNEEILRLYKEGKSNVAIAKELGLGVGEVKLVIDLAKM